MLTTDSSYSYTDTTFFADLPASSSMANPFVRARRARFIDPLLEKTEELVEPSPGEVRADVVHELVVMMIDASVHGDGRDHRFIAFISLETTPCAAK